MSDSPLGRALDDTDVSDGSPPGSAVDLVPRPDSDADTDATEAGRRRRLDLGLLTACFVIACGLAAIVWGVGSAITGGDGIDRPSAIESLSPVENAQQVVQQEQIVVDLEFGYEAVLVVDGIELPTTRIGEFRGDLTPEAGQQISIPPTAVFDPGNSRIEFRPSDDAPITSYAEGRHQVQVIYWPIEDGRENGARSYRWSFDVV